MGEGEVDGGGVACGAEGGHTRKARECESSATHGLPAARKPELPSLVSEPVNQSAPCEPRTKVGQSKAADAAPVSEAADFRANQYLTRDAAFTSLPAHVAVPGVGKEAVQLVSVVDLWSVDQHAGMWLAAWVAQPQPPE